MKQYIALLAIGLCMAGEAAAQAPAAGKWIERVPMGSGLQNAHGIENARVVGDYGVWHAPQYMPGFPTAATIWPRVVEVRCRGDRCSGYENSPAVGRGEYLFFRPGPEATGVREVLVGRPAPLRDIGKRIKQ